jgi:hypothetical protein
MIRPSTMSARPLCCKVWQHMSRCNFFFSEFPFRSPVLKFFSCLDIIQLKFKVSIKSTSAWLAQSVERETLMFHFLTRRLIHLHLKVAGSTPASGFVFLLFFTFFYAFCVTCRPGRLQHNNNGLLAISITPYFMPYNVSSSVLACIA